MKINQYLRIFPVLAGISLLLMAVACSPKVANGGYVREGNIKDQIIVGQSSKDDVKTKLGSPSSQSSFGDETWYYITQKQETIAFLKPEVVSQDVIRIQFDSSGVVSKVDTYNQDNSADISIVKRSTPTEGHQLGFWEQLLGNIGRFNHPTDTNVSPSAHPGGR